MLNVGRIIRVLAIVGFASLLVVTSVGCKTTYTLQAIIASPRTVNLAPSESQQLTVTAGYDKGASLNVTTGCTFRTTAEAIATVTTTGIIKGIAAGSANIVVSYTENRMTKTSTVTVTVK
jgi:hypothetical protein